MIAAIKESAASFELIQNHPSGDPTLSQQDLEITHRISKTGKNNWNKHVRPYYHWGQQFL
jgi:DNA repair protein RadC